MSDEKTQLKDTNELLYNLIKSKMSKITFSKFGTRVYFDEKEITEPYMFSQLETFKSICLENKEEDQVYKMITRIGTFNAQFQEIVRNGLFYNDLDVNCKGVNNVCELEKLFEKQIFFIFRCNQSESFNILRLDEKSYFGVNMNELNEILVNDQILDKKFFDINGTNKLIEYCISNENLIGNYKSSNINPYQLVKLFNNQKILSIALIISHRSLAYKISHYIFDALYSNIPFYRYLFCTEKTDFNVFIQNVEEISQVQFKIAKKPIPFFVVLPENLNKVNQSIFKQKISSNNANYKLVAISSDESLFVGCPTIKATDSHIANLLQQITEDMKNHKYPKKVSLIKPRKPGDAYKYIEEAKSNGSAAIYITPTNPSIQKIKDDVENVYIFFTEYNMRSGQEMWIELSNLFRYGTTLRPYKQPLSINFKEKNVYFVPLQTELCGDSWDKVFNDHLNMFPVIINEIIETTMPPIDDLFNTVYQKIFMNDETLDISYLRYKRIKETFDMYIKYIDDSLVCNEQIKETLAACALFQTQTFPDGWKKSSFILPYFTGFYEETPKFLGFIHHGFDEFLEQINVEDTKIKVITLSNNNFINVLSMTFNNNEDIAREAQKEFDGNGMCRVIKNELRQLSPSRTLVKHIIEVVTCNFLKQPICLRGNTSIGKTYIRNILNNFYNTCDLDTTNKIRTKKIDLIECDFGVNDAKFNEMIAELGDSFAVMCDEANTPISSLDIEMKCLNGSYKVQMILTQNQIETMSEVTKSILQGGLKINVQSKVTDCPLLDGFKEKNIDVTSLKYNVNSSLLMLDDITISREFATEEMLDDEEKEMLISMTSKLLKKKFNSLESERKNIIMEKITESDREALISEIIPKAIVASMWWMRKVTNDKSICCNRDPIGFVKTIEYLFSTDNLNFSTNIRKALVITFENIFGLKLQTNLKITEKIFNHLKSINETEMIFDEFKINQFNGIEINKSFDIRNAYISFLVGVIGSSININSKEEWEYYLLKEVVKKIVFNKNFKHNIYIPTRTFILNTYMIGLNILSMQSIILCGTPGVGKSMAAKLSQNIFDIKGYYYFACEAADGSSLRQMADLSKMMKEKRKCLIIEEIQNAIKNENKPTKAIHALAESRSLPLIITTNYDPDLAVTARFRQIYSESPSNEELEKIIRVYIAMKNEGENGGENEGEKISPFKKFIKMMDPKKGEVDQAHIFVSNLLKEELEMKSMRSIFTMLDHFQSMQEGADLTKLSYEIAVELINSQKLIGKEEQMHNLHGRAIQLMKEWAKELNSSMIIDIEEISNLHLLAMRLSYDKYKDSLSSKSLLVITKNHAFDEYFLHANKFINKLRGKFSFPNDLISDSYTTFFADDFMNDPITITQKLMQMLKKSAEASRCKEVIAIFGAIVSMGGMLDFIDGSGKRISGVDYYTAKYTIDNFSAEVKVSNKKPVLLVAELDDLTTEKHNGRSFMKQVIDRFEAIYLDEEMLTPAALLLIFGKVHGRMEADVKEYEKKAKEVLKSLKNHGKDDEINSIKDLHTKISDEKNIKNNDNRYYEKMRFGEKQMIVTRMALTAADVARYANDELGTKNVVAIDEHQIKSTIDLQNQIEQMHNIENSCIRLLIFIVCHEFNKERNAVIKQILNIYNNDERFIIYSGLHSEEEEKEALEFSTSWPVSFMEDPFGRQEYIQFSEVQKIEFKAIREKMNPIYKSAKDMYISLYKDQNELEESEEFSLISVNHEFDLSGFAMKPKRDHLIDLIIDFFAATLAKKPQEENSLKEEEEDSKNMEEEEEEIEEESYSDYN